MAGGGEEGERKCVLHGVSRPWPPYRYDIAASESPQGLPGAGLEQTTPAAYFNDQSQSELLIVVEHSLLYGVLLY